MVKKVGNYLIGRTLGEGAFGKVKLGKDIKTNEKYAVKIVDLDHIRRMEMNTQLNREIAIMKMLDHRNIVKLCDVLRTTKHVYFIIELCSGGELFDKVVSAKRFDEGTARKYFQELIKGLDYCHKRGIAHRDLKLENLLLGEDGELKITDFGLSKLEDKKGEMMHTVCGTKDYIAPEILKEKGYDGFKSDIWSAGVVLFVMLNGYLPFHADTPQKIYKNIKSGTYKWSSQATYSDEVKHLVSRILTVDPDKRMTIEEMKEDPWFLVDFQESEESKPAEAFDPSEAEVEEAIKDCQVEFLKEGENQGGSGKSGLNAFELASNLTAGRLERILDKSFMTTVVDNSTQFIGKGNYTAFLDEFIKVLNELDTQPKEKKISEVITKIKCSFVDRETAQAMTFTVSVAQLAESQAIIVDVRRGRGSRMRFNDIYQKILEMLGSYVSTTKVSETQQKRMNEAIYEKVE